MTIFDKPAGNVLKAKGTAAPTPTQGDLYRLERGTPFYRGGKLVYAVPQFRALNLFSPTTKNALLPTVSITPTQVVYPVKVK